MAIDLTIISLLEANLGRAKKRYNQISFCCPKPGCDQGQKFNLELNTNTWIYHCWACHYKGHVTSLLKEYASNESWKQLKEFQRDDNKKDQIKVKRKDLELPESIPFFLDKSVEDYLTNVRKIDKKLLIERNVRYVYLEESNLFNHILFPFYDITGEKLTGMCVQNFETKRYKNLGKLNYVPYINFINPYWPVILTEGVYDSLSVINSIPLLGTEIPKEILEFCFDKQVILALDRFVSEEDKIDKANLLSYYGAKDVLIFSNQYKDLNEFHVEDNKGLVDKTKYIIQQLQNLNVH